MQTSLICMDKIEINIVNKIVLENSIFEGSFTYLPNLLRDISGKESINISSTKFGDLFSLEFDSICRLINYTDRNMLKYSLEYTNEGDKLYVFNKIDSNLILIFDNEKQEIVNNINSGDGTYTSKYDYNISDENIELESRYTYNIYDNKFNIIEEGSHNIDWYSFIIDERYPTSKFVYNSSLIKIDVSYKEFYKYTHEVVPKYNTMVIEYDSPTSLLIKSSKKGFTYHKVITNKFSLPDTVYKHLNTQEIKDTIVFKYNN